MSASIPTNLCCTSKLIPNVIVFILWLRFTTRILGVGEPSASDGLWQRRVELGILADQYIPVCVGDMVVAARRAKINVNASRTRTEVKYLACLGAVANDSALQLRVADAFPFGVALV